MKASIKFFSICLLAGLLTAGVSFSNDSFKDLQSVQSTSVVLDLADDDCYTYERVLIDGVWWIFVYDCDGHLIDVHIETEV